jgi:hypothetical protein
MVKKPPQNVAHLHKIAYLSMYYNEIKIMTSLVREQVDATRFCNILYIKYKCVKQPRCLKDNNLGSRCGSAVKGWNEKINKIKRSRVRSPARTPDNLLKKENNFFDAKRRRLSAYSHRDN